MIDVMESKQNVIQFNQELKESIIAFKLGADGIPRFVNRTNSFADSLALLAFARAIVDSEMTKIVCEVSAINSQTEIAA